MLDDKHEGVNKVYFYIKRTLFLRFCFFLCLLFLYKSFLNFLEIYEVGVLFSALWSFRRIYILSISVLRSKKMYIHKSRLYFLL